MEGRKRQLIENDDHRQTKQRLTTSQKLDNLGTHVLAHILSFLPLKQSSDARLASREFNQGTYSIKL